MDSLIRGLTSALAALAAGTVLYLFSRDAGKPVKKGVLSYGPALSVVGMLGASIFLVVGYFTYLSEGFHDPVPFVILLILLLLCLAVVLEGTLVRLRYDDLGIHTSSPWRRSRTIPWYAITGYRWSGINKWHILETREYGRVRLSIYLRGLTDFFKVLRQRAGVVLPRQVR